MACLNTVTIICIFAALVGNGAATTTKVATTTRKATTTGKVTITTTADQGPTTTLADQGTTTTTVDQGTTTKAVDQGTTTTSMADQGASTTTTTADQGTPSTTAKQGATTTAKQGATTTAKQGSTTTTTAAPVGAATTVTTTLMAAMTTFTGMTSVTATNVTKPQMETASRNAIATQFGVSSSAVSVIVTESRRLAESALRKLAGTWTITYTLTVLSTQAASVEAKVTGGSANTFKATLADALTAAGAPSNVVLQVLSFSAVRVEITTTMSAVTTTGATPGQTASTTLPVTTTAEATATGTTTKTMSATTTQFLEPVPLTGGSSLRETAFLSVILLSTTMMTLSRM